jgi:hypothetical protein
MRPSAGRSSASLLSRAGVTASSRPSRLSRVFFGAPASTVVTTAQPITSVTEAVPAVLPPLADIEAAAAAFAEAADQARAADRAKRAAKRLLDRIPAGLGEPPPAPAPGPPVVPAPASPQGLAQGPANPSPPPLPDPLSRAG